MPPARNTRQLSRRTWQTLLKNRFRRVRQFRCDVRQQRNDRKICRRVYSIFTMSNYSLTRQRTTSLEQPLAELQQE